MSVRPIKTAEERKAQLDGLVAEADEFLRTACGSPVRGAYIVVVSDDSTMRSVWLGSISIAEVLFQVHCHIAEKAIITAREQGSL